MSAYRSCRAGVIVMYAAQFVSPLLGQWTGGPTGPISYTGGSVSIGTPNTVYTLEVVNTSPPIGSTGYSFQGGVQARRADGTLASPMALSSGDWIGQFDFHGFNGSGFTARTAGMGGYAAENWTTTANGTYLIFETTAIGTTALLERMRIDQSGNVGIGTTSPQHLLHVAGTIGATEIIVSATGADYVFQPGYRLQPLNEVAKYIEANHRLPDIPSADEVKQKGMGVGEMEAKLLAKVEELTLHMIQQERENQGLLGRIAQLEKTAAAPPAPGAIPAVAK
jgi:hypothetical protein